MFTKSYGGFVIKYYIMKTPYLIGIECTISIFSSCWTLWLIGNIYQLMLETEMFLSLGHVAINICFNVRIRCQFIISSQCIVNKDFMSLA